jgi:hypothetical protein
MRKFVGLCLVILTIQSARAWDLTTEEKLSDFQQLVSMVKAGYGPLRYKKEAIALDLETVAKQYESKIEASGTNRDFYYLLLQFIAEFRDSHFGASLPTSQVASLPFSTDLVDGKVLVDGVDLIKTLMMGISLEKGDEVVALNGVPIGQVLDELQKFIPAGYAATSRRVAAMAVSWRRGMRLPVPQGPVAVTVRKLGSSAEEVLNLEWHLTGEPMDEAEKPKPQLGFASPRARDYDMISTNDFWAEFGDPRFERGFQCSGKTRIMPPENAVVVMTDPIVAYYYATPKGNIGYLRIPEYQALNPKTGQSEFEVRFQQYEYAVSVFEKETVGLVIDQDHNCGGSVEFLHKVVSLFFDKPVAPMQFRLLGSKQEAIDFRNWLNELSPNTIGFENLKKTLGLIETAWKTKAFMTPKTSISGAESIYPNPVRYSKPILMLIDELSGSGGDAFPAMMQGYGRAKLLGTRTMGAGGHVSAQPPLNYSRLNVRMTKSLFYRPDGVAVENNGAVPDFAYRPTGEDFTKGYGSYRTFYEKTLLSMLP